MTDVTSSLHHPTEEDPRPADPTEAWAALAQGNARFMAAAPRHPHQDVHSRTSLAVKQRPFAIFFGCADSRVAAEIIFDQGLGDLFVVRTAGHVVDSSVLGSLEFGVGVLGCPLIVVLGHDSCGAVAATIAAVESGDMPPGFLRDIVERVAPSVLHATRHGRSSIEEIGREHVAETTRLLGSRSALIQEYVREGRLAIVGAEYDLAHGRVRVVESVGDVTFDDEPVDA
jgi:carbonic anhydrase